MLFTDIVISAVSLTLSSVYFIIFLQNFTGGRHGNSSYIREGIKCIIDWEELGFKVCGEAANGEEALKQIYELHPSLVLLDIKMPKLTGLEVVENAREHGYNGKFIILSGFSDFKFAQTAIRLGVENYITKPIDEDELSEA